MLSGKSGSLNIKIHAVVLYAEKALVCDRTLYNDAYLAERKVQPTENHVQHDDQFTHKLTKKTLIDKSSWHPQAHYVLFAQGNRFHIIDLA